MSRLLLKVLLWFALLLLAGVLAHFMVRYPGYVMVAWGEWMLEVTLWTAVGALVVVLLLTWLVVRLLRGANPVRLARRYRDRRDRRLARNETERAVKAWLKGDDTTALSALEKVVNAGGSERLPRLLTLLPAREAGDWSERQAKVAEQDPELSVVGHSLRADQLWGQGDYAAFVEMFDQHPELKDVQGLRSRYWQALMKTGQAQAALKHINQTPHLNPGDRERWQLEAGLAVVDQAREASPEQLAQLKSLPKQVRQHPRLVAAEVRCLAGHDKLDDAYRMLKKGLDRSPDEQLVVLLGELPFETSSALNLAEQLEKKAGTSAMLQWVLGQLCERASLWGKAQDYLQDAWRLAPSLRTGLALAAHYEHRQQQDRALMVYKQLAEQTQESRVNG